MKYNFLNSHFTGNKSGNHAWREYPCTTLKFQVLSQQNNIALTCEYMYFRNQYLSIVNNLTYKKYVISNTGKLRFELEI